MERVLALETIKKVGQEVLLKGWVNRRRDHGQITFVDLRDRSGLVQLVFQPGGLDEKSRGVIGEIRSEFVIEVVGNVIARSEKAINQELPTGKVEIRVKEIKILSRAESLPFDMSGPELNLELPTLLDYRSLS